MDLVVDRKYVSKYSQPTFALEVYRAGALGSADGPVEASLVPAEGGAPLWSRAVPQGPEAGVYPIALSSVDTSVPGDVELKWDYQVDGTAQIFGTDLEFGPSAPAYDVLSPTWSNVVDGTWTLFSDLFDSPYGGPNLQTYMQTKFGRNRVAQLLPMALQTLNTTTSPHASFPFNEEGFEFAIWGGLLQRSLYIEVVKHLVRSYTEQPEVILGTAVSRVDRRDYMQRWSEILQLEMDQFRLDLSRYKRAHMGLGNVHVLVSGGAYGKLGPYANSGGAGQAAARGYFAVRRYH